MNQIPQRVRRAAILVAAALLLASCANGGSQDQSALDAKVTPEKGGTLHVADGGEAISLNPFVAQDNLSQRAFAQVLEPLFRTDGDGEVVPWLVESSRASKDFTTWTFELRDGVKFSDGTPMTSDDVVYSLNEIRKAAAWSALYAEIETVEASSPSAVVVTTSVPSPAVETSLSLPFAAIAPKNLAGKTPEEFAQKPIGTGPFKVQSWERGQRLTLVRNESYWNPQRPFLDKVVFEAVPSDSSRAQQLRGGELDLIVAPPRPQLKALDQAPGTKIGEFDLAAPNYLLINQESDVFTDPRVREAVDLAINRASILEAAASGFGEPGASFIAPSLKYYDESLKPVSRDPGRARKLLAEAVADGVEPSFTLKIGAGNSYQKLASQIIKENLEDVGFTVNIEQLDTSAVLSQVSAMKYEASMFGMSSDIVDPSEVIGFYLDLDALWTGGETTQVRKLLKAAKQEADTETRRDLYAQIQKIVYDDRSLVVLDYQPWIWAMQENVVGFDLAPTGVPWLADVGFRDK